MRAVPPVVEALADELRTTLGDALVGVYLAGSFARGDNVATSDYDVAVVVERPLGPADQMKLAALHERLLRDHAEAVRLEGEYTPRSWFVPQGARYPTLWFDHGRLQPEPGWRLSADNIADLRANSIAVVGPAPETLLPSVDPEQVREAVREMLNEADQPASEAEAAQEIVGLLRSMAALETGAPAGKAEGVRWGTTHLAPEWRELIHEADAVRSGRPATDGDELRRGLARLRDELRQARLTEFDGSLD